MKYCPSCKNFKSSDEICEDCGTSLLNYSIKTCPNCKTKNRIDLQKCIKCGYKFDNEADMNKARSTKQEQLSNTEASLDQKLENYRIPIFVWISGVGLLFFSAVTVISFLLSTALGIGTTPRQPVFLILPLFFLINGVGLLTGRRISLIFKKVLWILCLILVFFSLFAASIVSSHYGGSGPDLSHLIGFLLIIVTAPIWSYSVKSFCNKSILGHKKYIKKEN